MLLVINSLGADTKTYRLRHAHARIDDRKPMRTSTRRGQNHFLKTRDTSDLISKAKHTITAHAVVAVSSINSGI